MAANGNAEIVGSVSGASAGVAGAIAAISASGAVPGLSAAGITSGLAAIGGGTMLGGIVVVGLVPIAMAAAGYGCVTWLRWLAEQ